ncbi:uncharacterized protein LOC122008078 isoform X1 [Zingiber officinale]|uniref:uncharacterized protein LOC122008078 isoform X1 n=1 Tax=Zingiber officinale TaxID=94328 RepID=UPI001C4BE824|nr:uncharacterized protein LOC122008078 isoform X1 [Zingiber officinale]
MYKRLPHTHFDQAPPPPLVRPSHKLPRSGLPLPSTVASIHLCCWVRRLCEARRHLGGLNPQSLFLFKPFTVSITFHRPWKTKFSIVKNTGRAVTKSLSSSNLICASLRSNGHPRLSYGGGFDKEPFWINVVKDSAWSLKSVAVFLAEQPSQIKYIEWPTFQSTLRTASLTHVLVALLIVALSSVDSCLCYILALLLRRTA